MSSQFIPRMTTIALVMLALNFKGGGGLEQVTGDYLLAATVSPASVNRTSTPAAATSSGFKVIFDKPSAGGGEAEASFDFSFDSTGKLALAMTRVNAAGVRKTSHPRLAHNLSDIALPNLPITVQLLRRGTFYLLYLNQDYSTPGVVPLTYVERATSDVDCQHHTVDPTITPLATQTGITAMLVGDEGEHDEAMVPAVFHAVVTKMSITPYRFESQPIQSQPVATYCPTCGRGCSPPANVSGCWAYNQIIPGSLVKYNATFYLYVAGQDYDGTDGGGRARIGVAFGPSLDNMTVHPDFLIEGTPNSADERSVFPNGAVVLDNGTIAMTYAGQNNGDQWGGIFLATSDCPVGCPWKKHGPVLHCGAGASPKLCASVANPPINEHDLIQLANGTFVVFYAGFADAADKGWMATSEDLLTWHDYPGNPALPTPTEECGQYPKATCWDGVHRRPRSLLQYKDYWYLIYEGTNQEPWNPTQCWGDTVGLMRSRTLEGPWIERHPLQASDPPPPQKKNHFLGFVNSRTLMESTEPPF